MDTLQYLTRTPARTSLIAPMRRGLKSISNAGGFGYTGPGNFTHCPDEEGTEINRPLLRDLSRLHFTHCPDEEGTEISGNGGARSTRQALHSLPR